MNMKPPYPPLAVFSWVRKTNAMISSFLLACLLFIAYWLYAPPSVQAQNNPNNSSALAPSPSKTTSSGNHATEEERRAYRQCLDRLAAPAQRAGVSSASYERFMSGLLPDMSLLEKLNYQPEFRLPIWDYMAGLVDEERIEDGKTRLKAHAQTLDILQARYGVDGATVVAVWGVESNFGKLKGRYRLIDALGTLSCFGRRQAFFQKELFATLRILQAGHIPGEHPEEKLKGSWAGAFGHTQFMPTTFERLAVDFDGDGRKDLLENEADALASTAHFLSKAGWRSGLPWGVEVKLPASFNSQLAGRTNKRTLSDWSAIGVRLIQGAPLESHPGLRPDTVAGLLLPAGLQGPAFLVTRNFDALYSYNAAESYGLAIAHLSDRLRGGAAFTTPWPTDDAGLSRAERRELQTLLIARGHQIGEVDGALGEKSQAAIKVEQARLGHAVTGRGGQKILRALRP